MCAPLNLLQLKGHAMNNKIYVGNLTEIITSADLKDNFSDIFFKYFQPAAAKKN